MKIEYLSPELEIVELFVVGTGSDVISSSNTGENELPIQPLSW